MSVIKEKLAAGCLTRASIVALALGVFLAGSAATAQGVHDMDFHYNPITQSYAVQKTRISVSEVQRDLVGALCGRCHADEVAQLKDSVHFKIAAPNPRILFPGGGAHGMLDRACGLPGSTALINYTSDVNLGECGKCHTGRYLPVMEGAFAAMLAAQGLPDPQGQAARIVNAGLDCLICHAEEYRAVPEGVLAAIADHAPAEAESPVPVGFARAARDDGDFDHDGELDPLIDTDGDGVPDVPLMLDPMTPWPTVAQDRSPAAVTSVGPTSEHTCLRCHEHARTGYKRATLFAAGYDVHATLTTGAFAGANNRCTVCHTAIDHKFVRGHDVGGDLAAADFPPPPPGVPADPNDPTHLTCVQCHEVAGLQGEVHSARHLAVIACETCHIPYSGGITYSLYGHGGHVSFGRNAAGADTKLITADHMVAGDAADIAADFEAYKTTPTLVWFNGGASFLAQTLAVRGSPNAKITPFKPMANGMVFDARFFDGDTVTNDAGFPYNAHSMYRFFANGSNAEVFAALGLLDLTPEETRLITLADFQSSDPKRQAMAMMLVFPNMVNFDKQSFGFEHYLVGSGSPWDANHDGLIDAGAPFLFDMLGAANMGLRKYQGFNAPMGLPADYQWYPPFDKVSQLVSMKLPDGSLMKMFMQMQAMQLPEEQRAAFLAAVQSYPAFSNGITLGGHGVRPKSEALGAGPQGCLRCHGEGGVLSKPVPVTRKVATDLGPMGTVELPVYHWQFYNLHRLVDLGVKTQDEDLVSPGNYSRRGNRRTRITAPSVDVGGDTYYVRSSALSFTLNWFASYSPTVVPDPYRPADDSSVLQGVGLEGNDLTWNGGEWMPVLEPVVDYVPNYAVLGYQPEEIFAAHRQGQGRDREARRDDSRR